jgi:hypothetical protein
MLSSFIVVVLSACVQKPAVFSKDTSIKAVGEKCKNAKLLLDKSIEEGQKTDLRVLKLNIERHCVWRRD